MKSGDEVTAQTLEEPGTLPKPLKGTLEIIKIEGDDIYPPFNIYFVDGKEANVSTIKPATQTETVKASSQIIYDLFEVESFYNQCHSPEDGRFCTDPAHAHDIDVAHTGLETFSDQRRKAILIRVENLQKEWGVRATIDARPTRAGEHQNFAQETGAIAAVAPWEPGIIHVNPRLREDDWVKRQINSKKPFVARTIAEAITHEYGHILEGELESRRDFSTIGKLHDLFTIIGDAELGNKTAQADRNRLRMEVSFYAGTDTHEGIAEAFTLYQKGQRGSHWVDQTGEILTQTFKKGGKKA